MCDPTGISETAVISAWTTEVAATAAASAAAEAAATAAAATAASSTAATMASYGMMGMSVASSLAQVDAQKTAASNQAAMNQRQAANAIGTMDANYNNVNLENQQARTAAIQGQMQNDRQAAMATGRSVNTTGSMGISGGSVDDLLGSIAQQKNTYDTSVTSNYNSQQQVFNDQRLNIGSQAASTVNSLTTPAIPSYALAGMQIADSGYKYTHPNLGT